MKLIIRKFLFLALILLSSCELSMMEYVVPEDQIGVDEPNTIVNEYGEFTYQYNDNVTPLNGEPQNYIVNMNDSVIWFMDNLPKKWIPKAGEYIAANCSLTIPLGLCSKVRSVTREAGTIRVEYEPATVDEVFKKYNIRVDYDYVIPATDPNENDSSAVSTKSGGRPKMNRPGYWVNDSVFVDMSLFYPKTRSETSTIEKSKPYSFSKTFNIPGKDNKVHEWYAEFTMQSTDYCKIHSVENKEDKIKEEWTDSYTERELTFLVGRGKTPDDATKSLVSFPIAYPDYKAFVDGIKDGKIDEEKEIMTINPKIPFPGTPFVAIINFEITGGCTLLGYGKIDAFIRTATRRSGYIIKDDVKTKIDKEVPNKEFPATREIRSIQAGGSIDVWIRGRVGAGAAVGFEAGGVGGTVGLEAKVGFKCKLETESVTDDILQDKQNFQAGFYATVGGYAEGIIYVCGKTIKLGDFNFLTHEFPFMVNMKAEVNDKKTNAKIVTEKVAYPKTDEFGDPVIDPTTGKQIVEYRDELFIVTNLNFSKRETFFMFPLFEIENQCPAVRIYETGKNQRKAQQFYLDKVLEAKKTYTIKVKLNDTYLDKTLTAYEVRPCVYDKYYKRITEYVSNKVTATQVEPIITQPKLYQSVARDLTEDDLDYYIDVYGKDVFKGKKPEDFAEYGFSTVVQIKNANKIKEWGLHYRVYNPQQKIIIEKTIPIPFTGVLQSGYYTVISSFISQHKPNHNGSLYVSVYPYCVHSTKQTFCTSEFLTFKYPYERYDGVYTKGNIEMVDL